MNKRPRTPPRAAPQSDQEMDLCDLTGLTPPTELDTLSDSSAPVPSTPPARSAEFQREIPLRTPPRVLPQVPFAGASSCGDDRGCCGCGAHACKPLPRTRSGEQLKIEQALPQAPGSSAAGVQDIEEVQLLATSGYMPSSGSRGPRRPCSAAGGHPARMQPQASLLCPPGASRLPQYMEPPQVAISVAALEAAVVRRLHVLLGSADGSRLHGAAVGGGPGLSADDSAAEEAAAHWLLRVAFSSPDAAREGFIAREVALLGRRWEALSSTEKGSELVAAGFSVSTDKGKESCEAPFNKLPPPLIAKRRVVLSRGLARVSLEDAGGILALQLQARLRSSMAVAASRPHARERYAGFAELVSRLRAAAVKFFSGGARV